MKNFISLLIIGIMLLISCKREALPPPPYQFTKRYQLLASHYWRLEHDWLDSSQMGIANPLSLPLANTQDSYIPNDSCAYFTGERFDYDGKLYKVKGKHCGCVSNPPCYSSIYGGSGNPSWKLDNNETEIYYGSSSRHILQLTDSVFSYYSVGTFGTGGNYYKMINVRVYKSYTDW